MAANTDKFRQGASGISTTLQSSITNSDVSATPASVSNIPTITAVDITIDRVDSSGALTPAKMERVIGVVSGANIVAMLRGQDNTTAQSHATGAVIEMIPTGKWSQDLVAGLLLQHNPDGTHGSITTTGFTNTGPFNLSGSWDGWVGANESWVYASASTITVPSDATTKYATGDFIKLTQSSTVKYFVVTAVSTTLLTVSGLAGSTVANSAITSPAYSKVRNPSGNGLNGAIPYNPVKFRAYRTAAYTTVASTATIFPFDTKAYDTGNNFNSNRFTVPVTGWYKFNGMISMPTSTTRAVVILNKNGAEMTRGGDNATAFGAECSTEEYLVAGDYIEMTYFTATAVATSVGAAYSRFSGSLLSIF